MNEQLKPFRTVEEIAKKHRLDVSFIERQLKMGEKNSQRPENKENSSSGALPEELTVALKNL